MVEETHLGVGAKGYAAGEGIRGAGRGGVGLWVRAVAPETPGPPKESGAVGKESRAFAGCKGQGQATNLRYQNR